MILPKLYSICHLPFIDQIWNIIEEIWKEFSTKYWSIEPFSLGRPMVVSWACPAFDLGGRGSGKYGTGCNPNTIFKFPVIYNSIFKIGNKITKTLPKEEAKSCMRLQITDALTGSNLLYSKGPFYNSWSGMCIDIYGTYKFFIYPGS